MTGRVHLRPARLLMVLVVGLALLAPAPGVEADCEASLTGCDLTALRLERVHIRQVAAAVSVPDAALGRYAAVLPAGHRVPESPRVGVLVRELTPTVPGLGDPRVEAVIALRTQALGEEGWFPLAVLTDSPDAWADGREIGLPTMMAGGAVTSADDRVEALIDVDGVPAVALSAVIERSEIDRIDASWALLSEPAFTQVPVFDGPQRWRVKQTAKPLLPVLDGVPALPLVYVPPVEDVTTPVPARRAHVTVAVDPDLAGMAHASPAGLPDLVAGPWLAGLLDTARTVPGVVWEADITLLHEAGNAHGGGGGPGVPGVGAGAGIVLAGPLAQTAGFATPVALVTQGGTLTFANLDQATHDVTAAARDGDGPLFRSELVNFGRTAEVEGVADLPAGEYGWFCSIHPSMSGTLTVL